MAVRRAARASIVLLLALSLSVLLWVVLRQQQSRTGTPRTARPSAPVSRVITAIGRIEPRNGIITLAPPSGSGAVVKVSRWLKAENDAVLQGDVLAELDSKAAREADDRLAAARLAVARARLARILSGTDPGERQSRQSEVQKAQQSLELARANYTRAKKLFAQEALSREDFDQRATDYYSSLAEYEAAKGKLTVVSRVRGVEQIEAQAEVAEAEAALGVARTRLNDAVVRSPLNGTLLKISAWPGTQIASGDGLAELGETGHLQVFAQVYEADIPLLYLGQRATVRPLNSQVFAPIRASVALIGSVVDQRDLFSDNSGSDVNTRVVLVKLNVDPADIATARRFIRLNVLVSFLDPRRRS